MKKLLLSLFILAGLAGISLASPQSNHVVSSEAQCKYKLSDANAGLKDLVAVAFAPKQTSPDGNMQLGFILYHNPTSADAQSVDAMELVVLDKRQPDKALTFMVIYVGPQKSTVFQRDIKNNVPGPCFQKSLQDNPKK